MLSSHFHPYIEGFEKEVVFSVKLRTKESIKNSLKEHGLKRAEEEADNYFGVAFFRGELNSFEIKLENGRGLTEKEQHTADKALENEGNAKVFQLEKIYNEYKDIAMELIQKSQIYTDAYIDELFSKYEGTLFRNREDVVRSVLGNFIEIEEFEKRPLAKFTHDIAKELGLF